MDKVKGVVRAVTMELIKEFLGLSLQLLLVMFGLNYTVSIKCPTLGTFVSLLNKILCMWQER